MKTLQQTTVQQTTNNNSNMVEIKRESACLRTQYFNKLPIANIYFYKDNKVLFTTRSAWLEKISWTDKDNFIHNTDILDTCMIINPVKKLKLDLSINKNFYMKSKSKNCWDNTCYDLYLYVDNVNIKLEHVEDMKHINGNEESRQITTYNYSICDLFITGFNESYKVSNLNKIEYELTERGKEIDKLVDEFKKMHINISNYDVGKLLKEYKIVKR